MSIKMTLGHLNNDLFWGALEVLDGSRNLPIKTSMKLNKLRQKIQVEIASGKKIYDTVLQDFAEVDENGQMKVEMVEDQGIKKPIPVLKEGANREEYLKKLEEFFATEIEIEMKPFTVSEFEKAELSPKMLRLLAPIMDV